jgi:DNA-binding GntR family transcriptional regulator
MNIEDGTIPHGARNRFSRMHDEIRNRICLLDYAPGTRLSEETLAAEFGVSRTPLRRVLARLEGEGLLRSMHGVGTIVTDVEIGELGQTYRLRLELAELIGTLDPVRPSEDLLAAFRALSARSKALLAEPDPRAFARLNMDYFLTLLQLTANEPLRAISERLYFQTTRIWLKSVFASRIDLLEEIVIFDREIQDVLRAIEMHDIHAAALIQRAHISMSFKRMKGGRAPD